MKIFIICPLEDPFPCPVIFECEQDFNKVLTLYFYYALVSDFALGFNSKEKLSKAVFLKENSFVMLQNSCYLASMLKIPNMVKL